MIFTGLGWMELHAYVAHNLSQLLRVVDRLRQDGRLQEERHCRQIRHTVRGSLQDYLLRVVLAAA